MECAICLDDVVEEDRVMLPCSHVFCGSCMLKTRREGEAGSCPLCRQQSVETMTVFQLSRYARRCFREKRFAECNGAVLQYIRVSFTTTNDEKLHDDDVSPGKTFLEYVSDSPEGSPVYKWKDEGAEPGGDREPKERAVDTYLAGMLSSQYALLLEGVEVSGIGNLSFVRMWDPSGGSDVEVSDDELSDEGSEGGLSDEGSEGEFSDEGSEGELSDEGSEGELSDEGSEGELLDEGSEDELPDEGSEDELPDEGSEGELSDEGSENCDERADRVRAQLVHWNHVSGGMTNLDSKAALGVQLALMHVFMEVCGASESTVSTTLRLGHLRDAKHLLETASDGDALATALLPTITYQLTAGELDCEASTNRPESDACYGSSPKRHKA